MEVVEEELLELVVVVTNLLLHDWDDHCDHFCDHLSDDFLDNWNQLFGELFLLTKWLKKLWMLKSWLENDSLEHKVHPGWHLKNSKNSKFFKH